MREPSRAKELTMDRYDEQCVVVISFSDSIRLAPGAPSFPTALNFSQQDGFSQGVLLDEANVTRFNVRTPEQKSYTHTSVNAQVTLHTTRDTTAVREPPTRMNTCALCKPRYGSPKRLERQNLRRRNSSKKEPACFFPLPSRSPAPFVCCLSDGKTAPRASFLWRFARQL